MNNEIVKLEPRELVPACRAARPPAIVEDAGKAAMFGYAEFFEAELESDDTLVAYRYAVNWFLAWCEDQGVSFEDVQYLAGYADPRTTRLYDRRKREVTRNIVERISI